jgi:hypothetical protein
MIRLEAALLCAILLLCLAGLEAQNEPGWQWASHAGGTAYEHSTSIAVDSQGNQYVTGWFGGNASFGSTTLTNSGHGDIFICKLDPAGNFLWAKKAGGASSEAGCGIAVDSQGNPYVTGYFEGSASFGSTTLTASGYSDIFVCKLDTDGNFLWVKQAGGTSWEDSRAIAVDSAGNILVTGWFLDSASFGSITLTESGLGDSYVCKLDPAGNFLWARQAGGTGGDIGYSIAVDSSGNSLVTGWFSDNASFGATTLTGGGIFFCKLDPAGNFLWANQAGGTSSGIAVDSAGNSYVTGWFQGSASFGDTTLTSSGYQDIFVCKLDPDGDFLWATRAGGTYYDWGVSNGNAIAVDSQGNQYVTGHFDLITSFGNISLTSGGEDDIFVCKLDTAGNFLWAKQAGGTYDDWGNAIAVDNQGNQFVTGCFQGSASFGSTTLTSGGEDDIFIARIGSGTPVDDPAVPELAEHSFLYPAWPNPCRRGQNASIKVVVAQRESGCLSVYNLRGELIFRGELASGEHVISLDSHELPSGIYFYRLATPLEVLVRKLAIIR